MLLGIPYNPSSMDTKFADIFSCLSPRDEEPEMPRIVASQLWLEASWKTINVDNFYMLSIWIRG